MKEAHVITAWRYEPGQRPRRGEPKLPVAGCRGAKPDDEFIDLYEVRHDAQALAAKEAEVTCSKCQEYLAGEDNRLMLLDVNEWIRKHVAAGDHNIRYVDIRVSTDE